MKQFLSISLAVFILLSGMHFTVAGHFCGGELADLKWSFTGETASCGMVESHEDCAVHDELANNCCQNKLSIYSIESQYNTSSFKTFEITQKLLNNAVVPVLTFALTSLSTSTVCEYFIAADIGLSSKVDLTHICTFRI